MIKIISTKRFKELLTLEKDYNEMHFKNIEMERDLNTNITWVEIGDRKLEKAMLKIDDLLLIKHEHKSCLKTKK